MLAGCISALAVRTRGSDRSSSRRTVHRRSRGHPNPTRPLTGLSSRRHRAGDRLAVHAVEGTDQESSSVRPTTGYSMSPSWAPLMAPCRLTCSAPCRRRPSVSPPLPRFAVDRTASFELRRVLPRELLARTSARALTRCPDLRLLARGVAGGLGAHASSAALA